MKKIIRIFIDKSFMRFILVGVINTVVGMCIMFSCYNLIHLGYWLSSALDYMLTSILSYFLNKNFTFEYHLKGCKSLFRFYINIGFCYFISFSIARPAVIWIFTLIKMNLSICIIENMSMILGSALFVVINYLGQRFFAFKKIAN